MIRRTSVSEDGQIELSQPAGIGEQVDGDDLAVDDGEVEDDTRSAARSPHGPNGPVHKRQLGDLGAALERAGHRRCTEDLLRRPRLHSGGVGPEHDIGVQ